MYAKVPSHLKEPLLAELRSQRFRSALKYYPVAVLFFAALAALVVFVKANLFFPLIRRIIPSNMSDGQLATIIFGVVVVAAVFVAGFFSWQLYKECDCQECLYCRECDAVDKYDSGECPICHTPLTEKDSFYYTTYKDEKKILERWGLRATRERSGSDDNLDS